MSFMPTDSLPDSYSIRREQTTLQRHRMVNAALADEFASGLHALSMKLKTPAEISSQSKQQSTS
jgi:acid stress-induced BolA-like protein IbaG/YrbA